MKSRTKKIVSLLLALCLLASLLPAAALAADAPANLIVNGDFEDAVEEGTQRPKGWRVYSAGHFTGVLEQSTAENSAFSGTGFARLEQKDNGSGGKTGSSLNSSIAAVSPGDEIYIEFMARGAKNGAKFEVYDQQYATLAGAGPSGAPTSFLTTTAWQKYEITRTVQAGKAGFSVLLYMSGAVPIGDTVYFDDVRAYKLDTDYVCYRICQAAQAGDAAALLTWMQNAKAGLTGLDSANAAEYMREIAAAAAGGLLTAAEIQAAVDRVNAEMANRLQEIPLVNSGFEQGEVGQTPTGWSAFASAVISEEEKFSGERSLYLHKAAPTDPSVGARSTKAAAVPGDTFYVEAMLKGSGNMVNIYLEQYANASASSPARQDIVNVPITADWSRVTGTFTMRPGNTAFDVLYYMAGGYYGSAYVDDVHVFKVNAALVLRNINLSIEEQSESFFAQWAMREDSGLTAIDAALIEQYLPALKSAYAAKGEALTTAEIQAVIRRVNTQNKSDLPMYIGTQRELFVEDTLIDSDSTAQLVLQKPQAQEIAINHGGQSWSDEAGRWVYDESLGGEPWEFRNCLYHTVFKDGDIYRMYYRGADDTVLKTGSSVYNNICYAESTDGVHWTKPELGICTFDGSTANNIILDAGSNASGKPIECFFAFRDTNPLVSADAQYKGILTVRGNGALPDGTNGWNGGIAYAFKSADGIHWSVMNGGNPVFSGVEGFGHMDSHNVAYWNAERGEYVMFFRKNIHNAEGGDGFAGDVLRTAATLTSKNFLKWDSVTEADQLVYYSDKSDDALKAENAAAGYYGSQPNRYQVYTNGVTVYDRAPQLYIGTPTRYLNGDAEVAPYLIASRDGVHFKWWSEMLIAPEGNRAGNRSNYGMWGLARTGDAEYSMYASEGYAGMYSAIRRFTFRVDGFVAAVGGEEGAQLITKPVQFAGDHLIVNYSAPNGTVRAQLTDLKGNPISGFTFDDCAVLTGDSIGSELVWTGGNLAEMVGRNVKLVFELKNAKLYSYQFASGIPGAFGKTGSETVTGAESARLNWEDAEFALSYEITVAEDSAFTQNVQTFKALANFVDIDGLDANREYFWKVRAIGVSGAVWNRESGEAAQDKPEGQAAWKTVRVPGKTLDDAKLSGTFTHPVTGEELTGSLRWVDAEGRALPGTTVIEADAVYMWKFTADDPCYAPRVGGALLYKLENNPIEHPDPHPDPDPDPEPDPNPSGPYVFPFEDVPRDAWYYGSVKDAHRLGLIDGMTDTTFVPKGEMTLAQAITLAARMHSAATTGRKLENGEPWYQTYVDYCVEKGIIPEAPDAAALNAPVTRAQYAEIFAKALPASMLPAVNDIPDDSIPDVKMTHKNAAAIYTLYRAGILDGRDDAGRFDPEETITRAEIAAILVRMMDTTARVPAPPLLGK